MFKNRMPRRLLGSDRDKVRKLEIHVTVVGKPMRKGSHGKPHTWKDNIKLNPRTVVCGMGADNSA